jgi:hypothetical protein
MKGTKQEPEAISMTAAAAVIRFPGTEERQIARMCLKGQRLKRMYGKDIKPEDAATALFGKRVGKYWYIPLKELERIFTS